MTPLDFSAAEFLGSQVHTAHTGGSDDVDVRADVAIVGTGPGGLAAAWVMAEAGMKVVMLEAGQFWPRGSFRRSQMFAMQNLMQDAGARIMMGNTHVPLISGKGVGGGTLINSGISFRCPDHILDQWMNDLGIGFWEDRATLYAQVEAAIGVEPTPPHLAGPNGAIARRGFEALGVEHAYMPRNAPGCVGCGTCGTGCPSGGKASSDLNWLPAALRHGANVFADTEVEHILMHGQRAVGVRGLTRDPQTRRVTRSVTVRADRVVLAAGAVNTPILLMQHRLANSSGLLGTNLHVQPGCAIVAEFDEEVRIWNGATQGYYAHHPEDREILAETFSAPPEAFFTAVGDPGLASHEFLRQLKHLAGCGFMIRDHSAGTLRPGGRKQLPQISYRMTVEDRQRLNKGMDFVMRMFFAAGAKRVRPFMAGSTWFTNESDALAYARAITDPADFVLYASHPMGTASLGADPRTSVVRPFDGRTHDHPGLHVLDASLFPTAMGVNPQVSIMATSLALARVIARDASA